MAGPFPGMDPYIECRENWPDFHSGLIAEVQSQKVSLVEIDLLLGGHRVPMKTPLRDGHYFVVVARGHKLPTAEVYSWSIRDRLPAIPIPLRAPDGDVPIDLQELVGRVYDLGRYGRTLRHNQPLPQPWGVLLHREDREWTEGIGAGA